MDRAEASRLVWAFVLSIALHLFVFGTYQAGKKLGIWQRLHWPSWMRSEKMLTEVLKKKAAPPPQQQQNEIPLLFVDVSPAQASAEAPKTARFYSDKNSHAANPNPSQDTETPKISGKQTEVVRTEDVPKAKTFPLQPVMPKPEVKEDQEETTPKPAYTPGDMVMAKPETTPRTTTGQADQLRPRTIKEALARQQQNNRLAGEKIKQDGGVRRGAVVESLDVMATPFGAYDAAIIAAVQNRWFDLLDSRSYASDSNGKVAVKFRLNSDGTVSEMSLMEYSVDLASALLCQSAIKDPAPFAPWPSDMKRLVGSDSREVMFTFYYH